MSFEFQQFLCEKHDEVACQGKKKKSYRTSSNIIQILIKSFLFCRHRSSHCSLLCSLSLSFLLGF